ncbi:ABC transporter ATP-binding protein [Kitasatospora sp. CM 4170]|uniref:Dipeptide ABC transporter ATP-binding protein n=1 Tax=Kitasatospora aburaviensis TaxID=67265 RepID=A0ABW1F9V2_9ACTN|nr:ABC transporter ATP-binding protein [Kitasatospora sp. CM 4170]WNM44560.1 ABC transporter ATP-binding protein [Kitasatospora sp. CM 4170]
MSRRPVLKVRDLTVEFAGTRAVDGVGFELAAGDTLGLVGESGSGKSTTALALLRMLPAGGRITAGSVELDGQDLAALPEPALRGLRGRRIAMVFQDPMSSLNPVLTVGRQLDEALRAHGDAPRACLQTPVVRPEGGRVGVGVRASQGGGGSPCGASATDDNAARCVPRRRPADGGLKTGPRAERAARAAGLLDLVGIPDAAGRLRDHPHQFSGGQRQRIMIALALAHDAEVLVADEPTTALDPTVQQQILHLLARINRETGTALVVISHDLGVIARTCRRILVMRGGRVVEHGGTAEVLAAPRHPYTKELLAAVPRLDAPSGAAANSTPGEEPLLTVRGLGKTYGPRRRPVTALADVDLELHPGETLGLVGESGSGKSTLARALVGVHAPSAGSIRFRGEEFGVRRGGGRADTGRAPRREIQMVFQDPYSSLNPRLTAGRIIAEPLIAHGLGDRAARERRVAELLEQVGLDPSWADRQPRSFSGGQRQRIGIARALAPRPSVLICDEPVSALDVSVQAQVIELLARLQRELGLAVLFIAHDLAVVRQVSHRIAVMHRGRIVETGPADRVVTAPEHPYTAELLAAVPRLDAASRPGAVLPHETVPPSKATALPAALPAALPTARSTR